MHMCLCMHMPPCVRICGVDASMYACDAFSMCANLACGGTGVLEFLSRFRPLASSHVILCAKIQISLFAFTVICLILAVSDKRHFPKRS